MAVIMVCVVPAAFAAPQAEPPAQSQRVTVSFEDVPAADAIAQLRWLAGVPIIFQPPAARLSLSLEGVSLEEALTAVCGEIGYRWRAVGSVYVLGPAPPEPLLPTAADLEERALYADRQRLDAAQLVLGLAPEQVAGLAQGQTVADSDLAPAPRELLEGIYTRLVRAARDGWIAGAQSLAAAPEQPPASLAFGIRGFVWRLEWPAATAAAPPPSQAAQPEQVGQQVQPEQPE